MTKKEIEIQIALGTYLSMKWKESKKLVKEGRKLYERGNKLWKEGKYNESVKLRKEANELWIESTNLYETAVGEVYGDREVRIDWFTGEVKLGIYYN